MNKKPAWTLDPYKPEQEQDDEWTWTIHTDSAKPYYPWVRVAIVLGMAVMGWLAFVVVLWAMARLIWP